AARKANTPVDADLVAADNDFGFRLFQTLAQKADGQNLFVSPPSIALALDMVYQGARGETQQGMAKTLGLKQRSAEDLNAANAALTAALVEPDPKVQLTIANSLWLKPGFEINPDFTKANREFYGAEVGVGATADAINAWVRKQTHDKIDQI